VAKGVGMVKGYGQYRFLGQTLLIELKSTTITIPKITKVKPVNTRTGRTLQISGNGFGKTMGKVLVGGAEINILSWKNSTIPEQGIFVWTNNQRVGRYAINVYLYSSFWQSNSRISNGGFHA